MEVFEYGAESIRWLETDGSRAIEVKGWWSRAERLRAAEITGHRGERLEVRGWWSGARGCGAVEVRGYSRVVLRLNLEMLEEAPCHRAVPS